MGQAHGFLRLLSPEALAAHQPSSAIAQDTKGRRSTQRRIAAPRDTRVAPKCQRLRLTLNPFSLRSHLCVLAATDRGPHQAPAAGERWGEGLATGGTAGTPPATSSQVLGGGQKRLHPHLAKPLSQITKSVTGHRSETPYHQHLKKSPGQTTAPRHRLAGHGHASPPRASHVPPAGTLPPSCSGPICPSSVNNHADRGHWRDRSALETHDQRASGSPRRRIKVPRAHLRRLGPFVQKARGRPSSPSGASSHLKPGKPFRAGRPHGDGRGHLARPVGHPHKPD